MAVLGRHFVEILTEKDRRAHFISMNFYGVKLQCSNENVSRMHFQSIPFLYVVEERQNSRTFVLFKSFIFTGICILTVAPVIEIHPKGGSVSPNANVILECYSSRAETYKWSKDGYYVDIMGNSHINLLPNGSLEIKEFSAADNGEYWCIAINPTGEVGSQSCYVGIVGKIKEQYRDLHIYLE